MREVSVFKTWEEPIATMALDFLRAEGIHATSYSDVPRSVFPFTIDGLGEIEIRVPEESAGRAVEVIAVRFSGGATSPLSEGDTPDNEPRHP